MTDSAVIDDEDFMNDLDDEILDIIYYLQFFAGRLSMMIGDQDLEVELDRLELIAEEIANIEEAVDAMSYDYISFLRTKQSTEDIEQIKEKFNKEILKLEGSIIECAIKIKSYKNDYEDED